jgi:hypothetical protein
LNNENATEKYYFSNYYGNINWHLCTLLFQFSVSWSSEMQCGVIDLETWMQHTTLCCILNTWISFLFLCFWWNTRGTKFSYNA